jgi:hypothetical protein
VGFQGIRVWFNFLRKVRLVVAIGNQQVPQTCVRGVQNFVGKGLAQVQSRGGDERSAFNGARIAFRRYDPNEVLGAGDKSERDPIALASPLRAQFRETPRGIEALETFRDLRGVKRFTELLGYRARKILELKVTIALEITLGNRPAPERGSTLS